MCMQNIEHTRKVSIPILRVADLMSLSILRVFRIGPWYCYQCERRTMFLRFQNKQVPTFERHRSRSEFSKKKDDSHSKSIGNYIKAEQSLVMRDRRSRRYSCKFRDATVDRLLSGAATISQIRDELDVTELDILSWIADLMERRKEAIAQTSAQLTRAVDLLPPDLQAQFMEASEKLLAVESGSVVEGRVLPK